MIAFLVLSNNLDHSMFYELRENRPESLLFSSLTLFLFLFKPLSLLLYCCTQVLYNIWAVFCTSIAGWSVKCDFSLSWRRLLCGYLWYSPINSILVVMLEDRKSEAFPSAFSPILVVGFWHDARFSSWVSP